MLDWRPGGAANRRRRGPLRFSTRCGGIYPLEFAGSRCYICVMLASRGWMLRITGPILG
jgi:hypothetical protein